MTPATSSTAQPGRKRDASLDARILDAALEVLAEQGYDGMTMDAVAARANAGKATVYRRWPSKTHLVYDAIVRMGQRDVQLDSLPDTGSLRGDIEASVRPDAFGEQRLSIITGLTTMLVSNRSELAQAAFDASVAPWVAANRQLLERAVARGEVAASINVALLSRLIPAMCIYRITIEHTALDPDFIQELIEQVYLPAVHLTS